MPDGSQALRDRVRSRSRRRWIVCVSVWKLDARRQVVQLSLQVGYQVNKTDITLALMRYRPARWRAPSR